MQLKEIRPEVARQTAKASSMSEVCGPEKILKICLFNFFVFKCLIIFISSVVIAIPTYY